MCECGCGCAWEWGAECVSVGVRGSGVLHHFSVVLCGGTATWQERDKTGHQVQTVVYKVYNFHIVYSVYKWEI